jgi:hypothetical protein
MNTAKSFRMSTWIIASAAAALVLSGCSGQDATAPGSSDKISTSAAGTPAAPRFIAGGDWLVPQKVGIGGYTIITDADAAEILNDKNASPAYTYYVNDQAFLQFSKEGEVTPARMLNFSFHAELLNFYQARSVEEYATSSPETKDLQQIGVALYRKVDNASTVLSRKITGPNIGPDTEMCANSGTGSTDQLAVCRVVRSGNIYLFEVRGHLDATEGRMWVNEFLLAVGETGLTGS